MRKALRQLAQQLFLEEDHKGGVAVRSRAESIGAVICSGAVNYQHRTPYTSCFAVAYHLALGVGGDEQHFNMVVHMYMTRVIERPLKLFGLYCPCFRKVKELRIVFFHFSDT